MFIERRKMMRKLLILMLVLGMAPMACATVSLVSTAATVGESGTVTIQVSSDWASLAWTGYLGYTHAGAALTSAWANTIAGKDGYVFPSPAGYAGYYQLVAADLAAEPVTIQAGIQFEGILQGITGSAEGIDYDFYLYNGSWTAVIDTFTLTVIPEPITLALLGLGGLLLRRRK
jgi:hypothetical protein